MWATDEADEDAEELNDVGVRDGVETAKQGVEDGDAGAEDDRLLMVHVDDHAQSSSCNIPTTESWKATA